MPADGFDRAELRLLASLKTPETIQRFLDDEIAYNKEPAGPTCYSPRLVLRHRTAHCMEGALLAAAALEVQGHPPLLVDLESVRDDDHILAVFRERGLWGAVAKSNYSGLRYRTPVYRSLRELVMSYFEHYYNLDGEKTLRAYSRPISLSRFERIRWRTAEEPVWEIPTYLATISHFSILPPTALRRRFRMDSRLFAAGLVGTVK